MQNKKILIAGDHAGFEMKKELVDFLQNLGYEVKDFGAFTYDKEDDYPDFVTPLAREISANPEMRGIILGGSGQGEAMCANRFKGVRAIVFNGPTASHLTVASEDRVYDEIILSREHNNSNVLSLGVRFIFVDEAKDVVKVWLETAFSEDPRHIRRLAKLDVI